MSLFIVFVFKGDTYTQGKGGGRGGSHKDLGERRVLVS
jgi:hypothetical protein